MENCFVLCFSPQEKKALCCEFPDFLYIYSLSISFYFFAMPQGVQNPSSPTRGRTCAPCRKHRVATTRPLGESQYWSVKAS